MIDDADLWREYMAQRSEKSFSKIVERHIDMVHSTARRLVGDSHAADVTQSVFIALARQARSIRNPCCLGGWLYRTTRFTAGRFIRAESRRSQRERQAYEASMLEVNSGNAWQTLAPLIDEAMAALGEKDQDALMLRFFENKTLREVAGALGVSDEAAQKRVERAVEKLRRHLIGRDVAASIPVLTAILAANTVQAAPVELASTVAAASWATSAFTAETLFLTFMSSAKAKAALVGLIALAAVSTSIVLIRQQDAKTIQSVFRREARSAQPPRSNTTQATTTKSFDEVITELRRLAAVPNYRLRHAGLLALANAVAPADISAVITRAEALLDSRVAAAFTNDLLSRLAEFDPPAAIARAQSLSNRERVIEGLQTVLETWVGREPKAMIAWAKNLPDQNFWPNSALRNEAMMAIASADPKAALEMVDQGPAGIRNSKPNWYGLIFQRWAATDLTGALSAAQELPSSELKNSTLAAVLNTWAQTDAGSAAAYAQSLPAGSLRNPLVIQVAQTWSQSEPARVAEWVDTLPDNREKFQAGSHIVQGFASADPKAAAAFVQKHFSADPDYLHPWTWVASEFAKTDIKAAVEWMKQVPTEKLRAAVFGALAERWAATDPAAAAAFAIDLPDAGAKSPTTFSLRDEKEIALRNIIKQWSNKDPEAAVAWINKLPPEQQNQHLASALETWALNNPADAAAYVAAKIPAGELQINAASQIASAWATADPDTAAQWVVQFPDGPVRERAMSGLVAAWATNDFVAAEHWLKSQPAEKIPAETIASYAYAAGKSDPPGAAQWAARLPSGPQKDAILNFVAANWMRVDQAACRAWVNTLPMPEQTRRRLLSP